MRFLNSGSVVAGAMFVLALAAVLLGHPAENLRLEDSDLAIYDFRATRELVDMVRNAAEIVRQEGPAAFEQFRANPGRWTRGTTYVYVYRSDGVNLFHGGTPELEGRNLRDVVDSGGRRTFHLSFEATADTDNPDGWVHYSWNPPHRIYSVSKSSCHYRVTMPDGTVAIVGGGIDEPPPERAFAKFSVDAAVRLLEEKGLDATKDIENPASRFAFREVKVFVMDLEGNALVDPALRLGEHRNLRDFTDDAGNRPFELILEWPWEGDRAWLVILTKSRNERVPLKRGVYVRRARIDSEEVVVGACVALPRPVWAK